MGEPQKRLNIPDIRNFNDIGKALNILSRSTGSSPKVIPLKPDMLARMKKLEEKHGDWMKKDWYP